MYNRVILTDYITRFKDVDSSNGIHLISSEQEEKFISYGSLCNRALSVLYNLQANGVKTGDELIFQIKDEDNEKFMYTFWACLLGGIIPVPITVGTKESTLKVFNVWRQLKKPKLIVDESIVSKIYEFAEENVLEEEVKKDMQGKTLYINDMMQEGQKGTIAKRDLDDIAFIQFSSGSTGEPKGVILTHRNLITNIIDIVEIVEVTKSDRSLSWMPLTHDMGIIGFHLAPLVAEVNQYLMPTSLFVRNPILWVKKVNEHRATILSSPNFGYRFLMDWMKDKEFQWDLSCIRKIFNGAEPISVDIMEEFLEKFKVYGLKRSTMYPVYGMAEASLAVAFPTAHEEYSYANIKRESLSIGQSVVYCEEGEGVKLVNEGFPVKNCSVRIVGQNNESLGQGIVGHIHIKGDNVTKGYYNNDQATNEKLTTDGWLDTGDIGFIKNNRVTVTGRYKDIIFVNGCNYYSNDLERVCENVDGVSTGKAVVCGLFDEKVQKEKLVIFVLFKKASEEFLPISRRIKAAMFSEVGINVDEVIPIKAVPKTTSGKIQRYKLIDMYKREEYKQLIDELEELSIKEKTENVTALPKDELEAFLCEVAKKIFKRDEIGVNDNFIEYGGNSLNLANIHSEIERVYPGKIAITDMFSYPTVAKLAQYIRTSNKVVFDEVAVMKEYLTLEGAATAGISSEFTISNLSYKRLVQLAENEGLETYELLLSIYIYLISKVSESNEISIQASSHSEDNICSVSVNINEIDNVSDLFKITQKALSDSSYKEKYSIKDLESVRLKKREGSIVPLFIKENAACKVGESKLLEIFDLVFRINEEDNRVDFICQSNGRVLSNESIEFLANSYLNLIELIVSRGLGNE